ncbi:hypothetical protein HMPREF1869_00996 [Bacteroidales bacterium KA00251]|nr:hypothetical protein HMPREF1869_00996 [Bacteroidales bacterium KA00251]
MIRGCAEASRHTPSFYCLERSGASFFQQLALHVTQSVNSRCSWYVSYMGRGL